MEATYFPAVSLYTLPEQPEGATLSVNFGAHTSSKGELTDLLLAEAAASRVSFLCWSELRHADRL